MSDLVKQRTKDEAAAGRRALKLHAAEKLQREIAQKMQEDKAKLDASPTPLPPDREKRAQPTGAGWLAPTGYIYLPDQIRSCIERAERAYQLAYHPGWRTRLARWVSRAAARILRTE